MKTIFRYVKRFFGKIFNGISNFGNWFGWIGDIF